MKVFKNIVSGLRGCCYKLGANGNILMVIILTNIGKQYSTDNGQVLFDVDMVRGLNLFHFIQPKNKSAGRRNFVRSRNFIIR
ncbi:hypothetical protein DQQ10_26290 [Pseudochryseolinea flava]|uniref:Uncharacterized protein n=1 Tax=Pseudochryseolinea flava TaxID=2059302 RepID=A0A364XUD8_9BACT|nr:hypothetical protein DQQ10_26290 [Pseudochryseolinea flava]